MKKLLLIAAAMMMLATAGAVNDTVDLPFYENFDTNSAIQMYRWHGYGPTMYGSAHPYADETDHSMHMWSDSDNPCVLVSPVIRHRADRLTIRFTLQFYNTYSLPGNRIEVGIASDTGALYNYEVLDSIVPPTSGINRALSYEINTFTASRSDSMRVVFIVRGSLRCNLDNVEIVAGSSCGMAYNVYLEHVDSTTADLRWSHDGGEQGFVFSLDDSTMLSHSDTNIMLGNLQPDSQYTAYIRTVCPLGDTTAPTIFTFRTSCTSISVPYNLNIYPYENNSFPNCWTKAYGASTDNRGLHYPLIMDHRLQLANFEGGDTVIVASAPIDHEPDRLHVQFSARAEVGCTLEGGLLVDENDPGTFMPRILITGEEYNTDYHTYDFYTDTVGLPERVMVAFRHVGYNTSYISQISITHADSCHKPAVPEITTVSGNAISIRWQYQHRTNARYEVCYSTDDTIPPLDSTNSFTVDTNVATVDFLQFNMAYYIWVRSLCGEDTTEWTAFPMTRTVCGDEQMPFLETFEGYEDNATPMCWDYAHSSSREALPTVVNNERYAHSGEKSLILNTTFRDTLYAIVPQLPARATEMHVTFYTAKTNGLLEAGLLRLRDSMFITFYTDSLTNGVVPEFHEFYTSTINSEDIMKVAFRWTPPQMGNLNQSLANCYAYIDDVNVRYIGACRPPDSVRVDSTTLTSASGFIHDHYDNGYYRLFYSHDGLAPDSVDTYTNYFTLDSLEHSKTYRLQVVSICYDGTRTDTVETTFATMCRMPITHDELPFIEDFENCATGAGKPISPCWATFNPDPMTAGYPAPYEEVGVGGSKGLLFQLIQAASLYQYAILPEFDYLDNLMLEFDVYAAQRICYIIVGTMADQNDISTFTVVDSIVATPLDGWIHHRTRFNNYHGPNRHIAIRAITPRMGIIYDPHPLTIDNIYIDSVPDCSDSVYNLNVESTLASMATFSWETSPGDPEQTSYVLHVLDAAGEGVDTFHCLTPPYTVSDLQPSTMYSAFVELLCGYDTAARDRSDTVTLFTLCELGEDVSVSNVDSTRTIYNSPMLPIAVSSRQSTTYQVFHRDDLNMLPSTINSLSVWYSSGAGTINNTQCEIYIGHYASDTVVWNSLPTDLQLCYRGPMRAQYGWSTYSFTVPFEYNGQDNIIVKFTARGVPEYGSSSLSARCNRMQEAVSYVIQLSYGTQGQDTTISTTMALRNIIKLNICPDEATLCNPPQVDSTSNDDISITVHYTSPHPAELYITQGWWNRGVSGTIDTTGVFTFGNLHPNTQYTIGIRQRCPFGQMSMWTLRRITTDSVAETFSLTPEVVSVEMRSATVSWESDYDEGMWDVHLFNSMTDLTVTTWEPTATLDGLTSGATYYVAVREYRGTRRDVPTQWSDTVSFTTKTCLPVSDLAVLEVENHSALLQWNDPNDGSYKWRIEYGLEGFSRGEALGSFTILDNPYRMENLSSGTAYQVYVASVCDAGNSVWSTPLSFTTSGHSGIASGSGSGRVLIYPNPTNGTITIKTESLPATLTISDINGRTVMQRTLETQETLLDLGGMGNGNYFVKIADADNIIIKKIIKQ